MFDTCIELAVARNMYGMLNQNVHRTFWLKPDWHSSQQQRERRTHFFARFTLRIFPLVELMATSQTPITSLAAVADSAMEPTSPHGSEPDWDFCDEEAAIQLHSDDLRTLELGATQQLLPVDQAHPGGIEEEERKQMADLAACVERLQLAREAVDQLSPVSSATAPVLERLGLGSPDAADAVAGAPSPMTTDAAPAAASSADGEADVPMTGTKDQAAFPTKDQAAYPSLPGFLAAKAQKVQMDAIRFRIDKADPNRVKFVMFPDSSPRCLGIFLPCFRAPRSRRCWISFRCGWTFPSQNPGSPG